MWSIVQVTEGGTLALTQQLSELRTNNAAELSVSKQALEVCMHKQIPKKIVELIRVSVRFFAGPSIADR